MFLQKSKLLWNLMLIIFFCRKRKWNLQQISNIEGCSSPPSFMPLRKINHCLGSTLIPYLWQKKSTKKIYIQEWERKFSDYVRCGVNVWACLIRFWPMKKKEEYYIIYVCVKKARNTCPTNGSCCRTLKVAMLLTFVLYFFPSVGQGSPENRERETRKKKNEPSFKASYNRPVVLFFFVIYGIYIVNTFVLIFK